MTDVKIAVLDLCNWPPEFMSGEPKFGEVLATWLARGVPEADLPLIDVEGGAPLPDVGDYDGYVISGSDKGVYDDTPWMVPLRAFLIGARNAGKPLLGICFGHQIMADVFGGKAEKVGPPEVGVRRFELDGGPVPAHVWHQDQVTVQPPGTRVLAKADYCPFGGLEYEFPALSVQFHPEYTRAYLSGFLERSRGEILSRDQTDAALYQIASGDVAENLFADRSGQFFRAALRADSA